jgi:hypothetical protein
LAAGSAGGDTNQASVLRNEGKKKAITKIRNSKQIKGSKKLKMRDKTKTQNRKKIGPVRV